LTSMDSKKLAAPPSSNQQGTLRVSDAIMIATSRNAPSTLVISSSIASRTRKDYTSSARHGKVPSQSQRWPDQAPTASRCLKAKTLATCGTSTSSVDSTPSLSTTLGAQVYTTTPKPLRCKRPPGLGTSLRTTLLQDPALTATNGSWAAPSDKGLQQRSIKRPCTPRSSLYGY
jgi:hypothetical protein